MQGLGIELRGGTQKSAHAALGIGRDEHHAAASLARLRLCMGQVGGYAVGLKVLAVESTQFIVRHAARIKGFAAQLGQRHHGVACRAATGAAGVQALHMGEQFGALRGVDQRHVALAHAHGTQQVIGDFVFGIDKGVADGVEVVMSHKGH